MSLSPLVSRDYRRFELQRGHRRRATATITDGYPSYRDAAISGLGVLSPRRLHEQTGTVNNKFRVNEHSDKEGSSDEHSEKEMSSVSEQESSFVDNNPNTWVEVRLRKTRTSNDSIASAPHPINRKTIHVNVKNGRIEKKSTNLMMAQTVATCAHPPAEKMASPAQEHVPRHMKHVSKTTAKDKWSSILNSESSEKRKDQNIRNPVGATHRKRSPPPNIQISERHSRTSVLTDSFEFPSIANSLAQHQKDVKNVTSNSGHVVRPSDMLATTDYLSKLLTPAKNTKRAGKISAKNRGNPGGPSDSSSSSSSESSSLLASSDDSTSSDSSSSSFFDSNQNYRCQCKRRHSPRKKRMILKPDPPDVYDGSVDVHAFTRFVTEGTAYVYDGHVPKNRRVLKLSKYLSGRAYQFYLTTVADDPFSWKIHKFFTELYNYCFPVTYRLDQRRKLNRCFQNKKSVREHLAQLNDLFNTVGIIDEREKAHKLWSSLNKNIQKGLWREKLNPEISTYDEIASAAELIEIIENIPTSEDSIMSELDSPGSEVNVHTDSSHLSSDDEMSNSFTSDNESVNETGSDSMQSEDDTENDHRWHELTNAERQEYLATGRCFQCNEHGHIARNCPETQLSYSSENESSSSQPECDDNKSDESEVYSDDSEETGLSLGMMHFILNDTEELNSQIDLFSRGSELGNEHSSVDPTDSCPMDICSLLSNEICLVTSNINPLDAPVTSTDICFGTNCTKACQCDGTQGRVTRIPSWSRCEDTQVCLDYCINQICFMLHGSREQRKEGRSTPLNTRTCDKFIISEKGEAELTLQCYDRAPKKNFLTLTLDSLGSPLSDRIYNASDAYRLYYHDSSITNAVYCSEVCVNQSIQLAEIVSYQNLDLFRLLNGGRETNTKESTTSCFWKDGDRFIIEEGNGNCGHTTERSDEYPCLDMSTTALGTLSTDFTVTILRARSSLDLTGALIALLSHLPNLHSRTWRMSGDSQHVYPHPTPARSKKHPNIFPIPRLPHSIRSPEPTVSTKTLNPFDHPFPSNVDPDKPLTTFNSFNDAFSSIDHIRSTGDSFTLDSDYGIAREKASSLG